MRSASWYIASARAGSPSDTSVSAAPSSLSPTIVRAPSALAPAMARSDAASRFFDSPCLPHASASASSMRGVLPAGGGQRVQSGDGRDGLGRAAGERLRPRQLDADVDVVGIERPQRALDVDGARPVLVRDVVALLDGELPDARQVAGAIERRLGLLLRERVQPEAEVQRGERAVAERKRGLGGDGALEELARALGIAGALVHEPLDVQPRRVGARRQRARRRLVAARPRQGERVAQARRHALDQGGHGVGGAALAHRRDDVARRRVLEHDVERHRVAVGGVAAGDDRVGVDGAAQARQRLRRVVALAHGQREIVRGARHRRRRHDAQLGAAAQLGRQELGERRPAPRAVGAGVRRAVDESCDRGRGAHRRRRVVPRAAQGDEPAGGEDHRCGSRQRQARAPARSRRPVERRDDVARRREARLGLPLEAACDRLVPPDGGSDGASRRAGGAACLSRCVAMATALAPANGSCPVTIS